MMRTTLGSEPNISLGFSSALEESQPKNDFQSHFRKNSISLCEPMELTRRAIEEKAMFFLAR